MGVFALKEVSALFFICLVCESLKKLPCFDRNESKES